MRESESADVSALTTELIDAYRRLNGADVSNAIETFGVRLRNEGFADGTLRCLYPELPPTVGYAVTARIRCSEPPPVGHSYHDRTDWWNYIVSIPAPRVVVVEDLDPRPGFGAFVGAVHASILLALGCVGYATNGSVRDVEAVRAFAFQLFAASTSISHGFAHIVDFGEPVQVAGLAVSSGDVLFGDGEGLLSVPPALIAGVPVVAAGMAEAEARVMAFCRSSRFSIDGLRELVRDLG
jgi:4-hydroxy-4-methyl-2-oxoglutarate aldolase